MSAEVSWEIAVIVLLILLNGFFEEVIQKIPYEPVRERVRERIEAKMAEDVSGKR